MTTPAPDRYAVVGHPIDHSRSPVIHRVFAQQTGENMSYEAIDAAPANFETAVRGFAAAGGRGLNITVPHKQAAFALTNRCGAEAQRAGAVNTISFGPDGHIKGDNTDGIGLIRDLTFNLDFSLEQQRILILGAGGATRGILGPILDESPEAVVLANRTLARAEDLQSVFENDLLSVCQFDDLTDVEPFDLIVNATSAGLRGDKPPFPGSCLNADSLCYDLAYSLKQTPFVAWALEQGAEHAVEGWGMLIEQAAESFLIWRGVRPDTGPILKNLQTGN
jgi:shikimate dehydrogenase